MYSLKMKTTRTHSSKTYSTDKQTFKNKKPLIY